MQRKKRENLCLSQIRHARISLHGELVARQEGKTENEASGEIDPKRVVLKTKKSENNNQDKIYNQQKDNLKQCRIGPPQRRNSPR